MSANRKVVLYDTTLRDGAQGPDVSFSAADKERIARLLDGLGFDYVEGGFPGSNPKDEELFARLAAQPLEHARLAAFGATRRAGGSCEDDANLDALIASGAPVWTLVGKSDTWQVKNVLGTTNNENLAMVEESVGYGVGKGREVIFDAEHFFDGFARDAEYAVEVCLSAARAGATWVVLCDTNGGSQPQAIREGVRAELSGRGNVLAKAREFGLELDKDDPQTRWLVNHLKQLEHQGYAYEAADASFEMLLRRLQPGYVAPWTVADFTTQVRKNGASVHAEATVRVEVGDAVYHTAASGNGPVNALDAALRKALSPTFPALEGVSLHDYKVRILNGDAGTGATTRVLIESGKATARWTTVGCSTNIIEASLLALLDSLEYAVGRTESS